MSSLKDLASLIMVPSLYKDGELHTVKPLGNSILHPDATGNHDGTDGSTPAEGNFTFSRGSNLAATRVDVNGLIEKGRENAITYSNTFNIGWNAVNASVTSGQAGYDGSSDAWLLSKSAAHGNLNINMVSASSEVHTFSLYAKANASEWMRMTIGSPRVNVFFNVANGTLGEVSPSAIDTNIESVGNGWYRCSFSTTYAAWVEILPAETMNDTGGTSGSLYIQDAQVEKGLVATDYIETGASTAQAGILEDMPRLDYSGSCPALLLEPQRQNLITHSEYLANHPVNRASVSSNAAVSPEGLNNASSLVPTTDNGDHTIQSTNSLSATTYTLSCFAKNNGNDISLTLAYNSSNWTGCIFDLVNGEAKTPQQRGAQSVCTADIEPYGDGWYKCSITATIWTAYAGWFSFISLVNDADGTLGNSWGRQSFVGVPSETAYLYGATLESGSYPTSYIPTYGSSVTRSGEGRVNQLASPITFAAGENFTLYFEGEFNPLNPLPMLMGGRTTSNAYWWITSNTGSGGKLSSDSGTEMATYTGGSITPYTRHKFLVKRDSNVITFYQDGVALTTTQGSGVADAWTFQSLGYGFNNVGTYSFSGKAYQAAIYPTALTDSECIALTTL